MCRKLRPHHGLCIQFFQGKGYNEEFTLHMAEVIAQLAQNPDICLVPEEDTVCSKCPNRQEGSCRTRDKVLVYDRKVLELCGKKPGDKMSFLEFQQEVREKIIEKRRMPEVCGDCGWAQICHKKNEKNESD